MNTTPYAPRIPIREYLAHRGILPRYERNGYGMYLSPLREERTPSFKVNYQKDLWYDFGIGEGGTLLALIMRLERCSRSEAFEHLQHAAEGVVSLLAAPHLQAICSADREPEFPTGAPYPFGCTAAPSGPIRISCLTRHCTRNCGGILSGGTLSGPQPLLFRHRLPE